MNIKPYKQNLIAKDLRTPKYKMRVVSMKKTYRRASDKQNLKKELSYAFNC